MTSPRSGSFLLGDWTVEPSLGRLARGARIVHLEPRVMAVLTYLADHPGEVVSKEQILDQVWADRVVSESALTRAMSKLRGALGDGAQTEFVHTVPRRGYCLVAPVTHPDAASCTAAWLLRWGRRSLSLSSGSLVIGRSPEADLRVAEPRASRLHARLDVVGQAVMVRDLDSKNGTFVNGRRLDRPEPLLSGDEIRIGNRVLTLVSLADAPTETDDEEKGRE